MGTTTYRGEGFKESTRVSGERPMGAVASDNHPFRHHANPPLILPSFPLAHSPECQVTQPSALNGKAGGRRISGER